MIAWTWATFGQVASMIRTPFFLDGLSFRGGDAVGADDDGRPGLDLVKIRHGDDAPLPEELDRLGVVDQGAVGVDLAVALVLGHVEDHVDGPLDAHAEPGRLCQPDLDVFDEPFDHENTGYRVKGSGFRENEAWVSVVLLLVLLPPSHPIFLLFLTPR